LRAFPKSAMQTLIAFVVTESLKKTEKRKLLLSRVSLDCIYDFSLYNGYLLCTQDDGMALKIVTTNILRYAISDTFDMHAAVSGTAGQFMHNKNLKQILFLKQATTNEFYLISMEKFRDAPDLISSMKLPFKDKFIASGTISNDGQVCVFLIKDANENRIDQLLFVKITDPPVVLLQHYAMKFDDMTYDNDQSKFYFYGDCSKYIVKYTQRDFRKVRHVLFSVFEKQQPLILNDLDGVRIVAMWSIARDEVKILCSDFRTVYIYDLQTFQKTLVYDWPRKDRVIHAHKTSTGSGQRYVAFVFSMYESIDDERVMMNVGNETYKVIVYDTRERCVFVNEFVTFISPLVTLIEESDRLILCGGSRFYAWDFQTSRAWRELICCNDKAGFSLPHAPPVNIVTMEYVFDKRITFLESRNALF